MQIQLRLKSVKVTPLAKWDFYQNNPPSFVAPPPFAVLITGYKGGDAIAHKRVLLDISKMNGPKRVKFGKKFRKVRKVSFEHEQATVTRTPTFDYYVDFDDTPTIDKDFRPPMPPFYDDFYGDDYYGDETPTFDDDDAMMILIRS